MSGEHIKDLKDGLVQVSIWKNIHDGMIFYSAAPVRRYKDKETEEWKSAHSFNRDEMLVVGRLMDEANAITRELENADRKAARAEKEAVAA